MATSPEGLAGARKAVLPAPAGYGKTFLMARAVASEEHRQLVLTHTHAGVASIRKNFRELLVSHSAYDVETIAGWSLHLVRAYPKLSGLGVLASDRSPPWTKVYEACTRLLEKDALVDVIRVSYGGLYVDEYQDCSRSQHSLVVALSRHLPCRVLGDPMQGIFNFGSDPAIDWELDVVTEFEQLEELDRPWRWQSSNPGLGDWLARVRHSLQNRQPILLNRLPQGVRWLETSPNNERKACWDMASEEGSVIGIFEGTQEAPCQRLARSLAGTYQCMEGVECEDLYKTAARCDSADGRQKVAAVIDFCERSLTKVKSELVSIKALMLLKADTRRSRIRKHLDVYAALVALEREGDPRSFLAALSSIRSISGAHLFRKELWKALEEVLALLLSGFSGGFSDAAELVQNRARRKGRRIARLSLSRTLLVKGLEFDHGIVFRADTLDAKQLYVALSRASKSLLILSSEPALSPQN